MDGQIEYSINIHVSMELVFKKNVSNSLVPSFLFDLTHDSPFGSGVVDLASSLQKACEKYSFFAIGSGLI